MKPKSIVFLLVLFINLLSCAQDKNPKNKEHSYKVVVSELDIPWGFVFLPDSSMLITEKSGELIHFKEGEKTMVNGIPEVTVLGQGGLMDIELHPNYKENGWLYLSYASSEDGDEDTANTTIMRAKLKNNSIVEKQVLYKASPDSGRGQHFGSRIEFDNEGFLFFSVGDRGNRDVNPQDISLDCGKVYRLNDDGSIPDDNPFIDIKNAKKAIFCYGNRNIQGMVKHPETGEIWTHEHGPKGGDEINIIKAGKNYGWPLISFGVNYSGSKFTDHTSLPGMEQPLYYWVPSIAPSGMEFISSDVYPGWKGNLLVGSLKFQYLDRCVIENNKVVNQEQLISGLGRVRSVKQGPDGYIYAGVENVGIVKIIPKK